MNVEDLSHADSEYYQALRELLWQLADDDLIVAYRASEWLGLAPHVEEDVAFSSIAQDEMGHAAMYFELLEQMGEGSRDDLSHLRAVGARRNAVLLEEPNGQGSYLREPHFDWAFTVVRHYFYDVWESLRLRHLIESSYLPLVEVAQKAIREEVYHLAHQELWLRKMADFNDDTRARLNDALNHAAALSQDLVYVEPWQDIWMRTGILPQAEALPELWRQQVGRFLDALGVRLPSLGMRANGRLGEHSPYLSELLATLSEVYRTEPGAAW